jgi:hypothetical protein
VILLWDLASGKRKGYLFDPKESVADATRFTARDEVTGTTVTYTLPCGSPIPPGAVCICNCVPGLPAPTRSSSPTTYTTYSNHYWYPN